RAMKQVAALDVIPERPVYRFKHLSSLGELGVWIAAAELEGICERSVSQGGKPGGKIIAIQLEGDSNLALVAQAFDQLRLFLGATQRGQKHAGENGDDGDDDQQFDQGEASLKSWFRIHDHALRY